MKLEPFVERRAERWRRLERLLEYCEMSPRKRRMVEAERKRKRKLARARAAEAGQDPSEEPDDSPAPPPDPGELPRLYRELCQDLALARHRRYGRELESQLNALALRGHHQLYRQPSRLLHRFAIFFAETFPRSVRANARWVWLSSLLFYGPFLAMVLVGVFWPQGLRYVLDPEMMRQIEEMYDPTSEHVGEGRASAADLRMFAFYIYNNGSIALRTFAGSLLLGVGTIFILLYNGVFIGAVFGHLTNEGMGVTLYPFVVGHGSFELTAIVLSGAAGLRLGHAIIAPGRRSRSRAMVEVARECLPIVLGMFAMIVIAAFVEGFWSPSSAPPEAKYAVGAVLWAFVIGYFVFAGRGRRAAR